MSHPSERSSFMMKYGSLDHVKSFIHADQTDTHAARAGMRRLEREDPDTHKAKFDEFFDSMRKHGSLHDVKSAVRNTYLTVDKALDVLCDPYKEGRTEPAFGKEHHTEIHQQILERQPNLPGHVVRQFALHPDTNLLTRLAAVKHKNMPAEDIRNIAIGKAAVHGMIQTAALTVAQKRNIKVK